MPRWALKVTVFGMIAGPSLVLLFASCKPRQELSDIKAQPHDRKVLGPGGPYTPLDANYQEEMDRDMRERRRRAWEVVRKVVTEVPVGDGEDLRKFDPVGGKTVPLWQTWYESEEFQWMFAALYEGMLVDGEKPDAFCPQDLIRVFDKHAQKALSFRFPPERFERRLGQLKNQEQVHGLSGTGVTLFSPGLLMHYLQNWQKVRSCEPLDRTKPPPSNSNFAGCFHAEFPNGRDGLFESYVNMLKEEGKDYASRFSHCKPFDLKGPEADQARRAVGGAVALKTSWQKLGAASEIGVFDTDAEGMKRHLGEAEWQTDRLVSASDVPASRIFTLAVTPEAKTSAGDGTLERADLRYYQLTGMHIVTKDVRDWMWITLWWSDDPDSDFGADRPDCEDGAQGTDCLSGPWRNYKMCVVTDYQDSDQDPSAGLPDSLARTLKVVHGEVGPYTWCSNPYVEMGAGNSRTNCIGCHQHAGEQVNPDDIILAAAPWPPEGGAPSSGGGPGSAHHREVMELYPHGAKAKVRANFPSDYLWSFSHGPDFFQASIIQLIDNFSN